MFTFSRHWYVSRIKWVQLTPILVFFLHFNIIIPSTLRSYTNGLVSARFSSEALCVFTCLMCALQQLFRTCGAADHRGATGLFKGLREFAQLYSKSWRLLSALHVRCLCFCDKCSANLCAAVTVSLCVFSQLTGPECTTIWMREFSMVVGAFSNFAKSLRPSVRPHETAVLPPPPGRIFMKLDICGFSENLSSKFKFH
jgi:hypothetical protein